MICPFCDYERKVGDINPRWECPSCQKAYGKFKTEKLKIKETKPDSPWKIYAIIIMGFYFLYFQISNLIQYGSLEICLKSGCHYIAPAQEPIIFLFVFAMTVTIGCIAIFEFLKIVQDFYKQSPKNKNV